MKQYADIVFLQGDEAEPFLNLLHENGESEVVNRLRDWDEGEYNDTNCDPSGGFSDVKSQHGEYLLTYNTGLGYIGLEKIIN